MQRQLRSVGSAAQHDAGRYQAYVSQARKYHPDLSKLDDAESHFNEVGEAYGVLRDMEKRAVYERLGSQWRYGQEFEPPPRWDEGF
ncbi:DnaJ domain-containing protein [Paraburkholderia bannensis]|uniref:DnaJ domain-containing protein n=1 Tax=Paraburkholderia TaxID=1822464 RepID=UPI003906568A